MPSPPQPTPEPDAATRYALGIAFKQMGIPEEAIKELTLAAQAPELMLDACATLALCLKDAGRYDQAITQLEEASQHPQCTGDKARSLLYELGLLYKLTDRVDRALQIFEAMADYQDVRDHIQDLRAPQVAPAQ